MNGKFGLEPMFDWLLTHSLQAGALVLLVLALQWIFRRQLTNRWRFALWWIVLGRLLLPFSPESAASLFNIIRPNLPAETHPASIPAAIPVQRIAPPVMVEHNLPGEISALLPPVKPQNISRPSMDLRTLIFPVTASLWFMGMLGMSAFVIRQSIQFHRKLAQSSGGGNEKLQALLDDCRREFRIKRTIKLVETGAVESPALFGLWRLRLLLPRGIAGQFSERELRYVFLHELAHVKRRDLWLNWLVTALQIVHWFNPLLWFGFARLRADRELACDELALLRAGDIAGTAYGETVVKLLENMSRLGPAPGLVGILEDKKQMKRRIATIADFRKPGPWSILAVLLLIVVGIIALTDAQSKKLRPPAPPVVDVAGRNDVVGTVTAKGGTPLRAEIFVSTAAPKIGASLLGPSCYADCAKHTRADSHGNFILKKLEPDLTFRLLAVAKGYKPKYAGKVDPSTGKVLSIILDPIVAADARPEQSLHGRVINSRGSPIEGAVVQMIGVKRGSSESYGDPYDNLAVTDEKGEFILTAAKPFEAFSLKISARLYAAKNFEDVASGSQGHDLILTKGATLTGRVVSKGNGVAGITVGVAGIRGISGGQFSVGTDVSGNFELLNLPPDADFNVYSVMDSMKDNEAVPLQKIHTGKDGETTDVGNLMAVPGHRLSGRVVLTDGQSLPMKTRLFISREEVMDGTQVALDPEGKFDVSNIPSGLISVGVRAKDYRMSPGNLSLDQLNPSRLIGRVDHDINNLVLKLDKGSPIQPDFQHIDPDYEETRNRPLRGAEGVEDHSADWVVSGHVLDKETKRPIQNFHATPGQDENFNGFVWSSTRSVDGVNGVYSAYISKRVGEPLVKIEADGYLPASQPAPPHDATNVDFLLQRGSGPAGNVLTAAGKAVEGASVLLLTSDYNQGNMDRDGKFQVYGNRRESLHHTDAAGHFDFKPLFGMKYLAAEFSNSFATVTLESFATNPVLVLRPYGKITGTMKRLAKPATNETLGINFPQPDGPHLSLQQEAKTDAAGRFTFDHVPAGPIEINCHLPMEGDPRSWINQPLQTVEVEPGQTLQVDLAAGEREIHHGFARQQREEPKPIPGVEVKGIVLLPSGQPAAGADVALQIEGKYLAVGKGILKANDARQQGLLVTVGADGHFTLPMYEKALSVVALNDEGYVQVPIAQLRSSPQITLQKWGRIEGTLRVGNHPGTNQTVMMNSDFGGRLIGTNRILPLMYESSSARTDDQGHFVLTFIPPGEHTISRQVPSGEGSWTYNELAKLTVKPGETVITNVGGQGRTVIGRLIFVADTALESQKAGFLRITTPFSKMAQKIQELKTQAEKQAAYRSPEWTVFARNSRSFSAPLNADGTFRAEDILPGVYEISYRSQKITAHSTSYTIVISTKEFVVPPTKGADDPSEVNWGAVEMKSHTYSVEKNPASAK